MEEPVRVCEVDRSECSTYPQQPEHAGAAAAGETHARQVVSEGCRGGGEAGDDGAAPAPAGPLAVPFLRQRGIRRRQWVVPKRWGKRGLLGVVGGSEIGGDVGEAFWTPRQRAPVECVCRGHTHLPPVSVPGGPGQPGHSAVPPRLRLRQYPAADARGHHGLVQRRGPVGNQSHRHLPHTAISRCMYT